MKSFTFRLETLLRLRSSARDRALADYASSIKKRELAERMVLESETYLSKLNDDLSAKTRVSFLGTDLVAFQEEIQRAKETKDQRCKEVARLYSLESSRRAVYLRKESEYKSLERFKERKASEHLSREIQKEEREQENVIAARYVYDRVN